EDGIRGFHVTGVQTCALPIWRVRPPCTAVPFAIRILPLGVAVVAAGRDFLTSDPGIERMIAPQSCCSHPWLCSLFKGCLVLLFRSEERRVGKEFVCRS